MPAPVDVIIGRRAKPPLLPNIVGGEERFEVKEVIDRLQYLVRWKGYGHKENSWLAEGDIDAPKLIAEFYRAHPNAPKCISTLAFGQLGFRLWHNPCSQRGGPTHRGTAP